MAPYRRVSAQEGGDESTTRPIRSNSDRFFDKVWAILWVSAALLVAKYTNFYTILLSDARVVKPLLYTAVTFLGINVILVLYLILYLPYLKGIHDSSAWDVYCPRVVPTMTGLGILSGLMLIRATWPIWGFLSPLLLGTQGLGFLFGLHFVPWF